MFNLAYEHADGEDVANVSNDKYKPHVSNYVDPSPFGKKD